MNDHWIKAIHHSLIVALFYFKFLNCIFLTFFSDHWTNEAPQLGSILLTLFFDFLVQFPFKHGETLILILNQKISFCFILCRPLPVIMGKNPIFGWKKRREWNQGTCPMPSNANPLDGNKAFNSRPYLGMMIANHPFILLMVQKSHKQPPLGSLDGVFKQTRCKSWDGQQPTSLNWCSVSRISEPSIQYVSQLLKVGQFGWIKPGVPYDTLNYESSWLFHRDPSSIRP